MEYREKFKLLSAPLRDVPDEMLVGAFLSGLQEEIRADVRLMHPRGLRELMDFTGQVEDRNRVKERIFEEKRNRTTRAILGGCWIEYKPALPKFSIAETPKAGSTTFGTRIPMSKS